MTPLDLGSGVGPDLVLAKDDGGGIANAVNILCGERQLKPSARLAGKVLNDGEQGAENRSYGRSDEEPAFPATSRPEPANVDLDLQFLDWRQRGLIFGHTTSLCAFRAQVRE